MAAAAGEAVPVCEFAMRVWTKGSGFWVFVFLLCFGASNARRHNDKKDGLKNSVLS
jgi:hypothetical protein